MMDSVNIYAFHGLLGAPTDWSPFPGVNCPVTIGHEELSLCKWAEHFNETLETSRRKNILLGYSLGGRLAMHVLLSNPNYWDGAIFVSAHPGLPTLEERELRLQYDACWAESFLSEPWDSVMQQWNMNPIFANRSPPYNRKETEFDRKKLSQQILNWSLGHQDFLLPELKKLSLPILYVAGALDSKFCSVAEQFESFARVAIIPEAAHRVPWEQSHLFIRQFNQFIEEIYDNDKKTRMDPNKNL